MQYLFSCLLLLLSLSLSAQEPVPNETLGKGITPINQQQTTDNQQQTFALVVGISDYQDEGIPDLQYAHRDARLSPASYNPRREVAWMKIT